MAGRNPALVRQSSGRRDLHPRRLPQSLRAIQDGSRTCEAARASAPFIVTWDNHEVDNDYAGDIDENDTPPEVFLLRRAAAYQAYYETMPLRAATFPTGARMRLYRPSVRQPPRFQRARHPTVPVGSGVRRNGHRLRRSRCRGADDAGAEQEKWLFNQLGTVKATWTLLGQQVPTFARDLAASNPLGRFSMDKWDGYSAARQRLRAAADAKSTNPVVLSGDVHVHYGADLKMDFRSEASRTIGVELTNSSVTSGSDGAEVAANWEAIRGADPHIKYPQRPPGLHCLHRVSLEMSRDFNVLDRVTVPDSPGAHRRVTLVVEAGRPGASTG